MKVLVCEDDVLTRKSIVHLLQRHNFEVVAFDDAKHGIDFLDKEIPDLVLTDLHMPQVTGMELLIHIRNVLKSDVPVLLITLVGDEKQIMEAFKAGVDDYLIKPFEPEDFINRVQKLVAHTKN